MCRAVKITCSPWALVQPKCTPSVTRSSWGGEVPGEAGLLWAVCNCDLGALSSITKMELELRLLFETSFIELMPSRRRTATRSSCATPTSSATSCAGRAACSPGAAPGRAHSNRAALWHPWGRRCVDFTSLEWLEISACIVSSCFCNFIKAHLIIRTLSF